MEIQACSVWLYLSALFTTDINYSQNAEDDKNQLVCQHKSEIFDLYGHAYAEHSLKASHTAKNERFPWLRLMAHC